MTQNKNRQGSREYAMKEENMSLKHGSENGLIVKSLPCDTGEETKDLVQAYIQNLEHSFVQRGTNDQKVHG